MCVASLCEAGGRTEPTGRPARPTAPAALSRRRTTPSRRRELMTPDDGVAVCMTGLHRTVAEWPVVHSFNKHLVEPHRRAGQRVSTFLVIVGNGSSATDIAIRSAYQPTSLRFMAVRSLSAERIYGKCSLTDRRYIDAYSSLTQWLGIRRCYMDVETDEARRGQRFGWLYRLRTDILLLADTPLAAVAALAAAAALPEMAAAKTLPEIADAARAVYVPLGGMSAGEHYACQNDHLFACPRDLCRPYFHLVELYTSQHCVPARRSDAVAGALPVHLKPEAAAALPNGTIFGADAPGGASGLRGAPSAPYWLPPLPISFDAHWAFFARYSDGRPCNWGVGRFTTPPAACCGLLRELIWPYALVRDSHVDCKCARAPPAAAPPTFGRVHALRSLR